MKNFLLTILLLTCYFPASAFGEVPPDDLYGAYYKSHQVRDEAVDCSQSESDECGIENVQDKLGISRLNMQKPEGAVWVSIELVGPNLHTCSAEGKAIWNKGVIMLSLEPGEFDSGICTVKITRNSNGTLKIDSEPYKACSRYCGARAYLESSGFVKKHK